MLLLEREAALAELHAAVRALGPGRLVLVAGEAGAGKSVLVHALLAGVRGEVRTLVGSCDSLRTPRPLGPLADWDAGLAAQVRAGAPRTSLFEQALTLLQGGPAVAVVEDVHWADEATLDLVAFLARRLPRTSAALVLTYRSDEVPPGHPLAVVLGELATVPTLRVPVRPLTAEGVAALAADASVDAGELHRRTGGNAFLVTECLAAGGDEVPDGVRAAVLARAAALPPEARAALDAVAVVPGTTELWLAGAVGAGAGLDEAVAQGLLVAHPGGLRFRHELARAAVEQALLPHRRAALHAAVLRALEAPPDGRPEPARLAHHAAAAGDAAAVARHAPAAAAAAEAAGARREAVEHLELALAHAGRLSDDERRALWSRLGQAYQQTGRGADAVAAFDEALSLTEDPEGQADLLLRSTAALVGLGHTGPGHERVARALALLRGRPPSPTLALAHVHRCTMHMLARELGEAAHWGALAVGLAREVHDRPLEAHALVQTGVARWMAGDEEGLRLLREGTALAEAEGDLARACLGLSQTGSGGGEVQRYAEAVPALERCIALAEQHELVASALYARAWLARCALELGRWDDASTGLAEVLRSPRCEGIARVTALSTLGRLRSRRGDPGVWPPLDEALVLARTSAHLQRLWPVAAARAEAADVEGRLADEVPLLREVLDLADDLDWPWAAGELAVWLQRAGGPVQVGRVAPPYDLLLAGDHRGAAAVWAQRGRPYDRAEALASSEDDDDQRLALQLLSALGAAPAHRRLVERRRAQGRPVPRGPNASTLGNPGGLTGREVEVLRLVAAGCSNREVGARLHLSVKTVGHHVSHVLTKLGCRSRAEAVAAAAAAGVDLAVPQR